MADDTDQLCLHTLHAPTLGHIDHDTHQSRRNTLEVDYHLASHFHEPFGPYGGLRWGELAALRRRRCHLLQTRLEIAESVSEARGELHFRSTKTYRMRMVVIPGFLRDLLAEHLSRSVPDDPAALVFTSPKGHPLRKPNFRRNIWYPALAEAGLPEGLRIHDLRHTCASLLISQGAHPKAIQAHLGHSSIAVTMDKYGHLFPSDIDALAHSLDRARSEALERMEAGAGAVVTLEAHG